MSENRHSHLYFAPLDLLFTYIVARLCERNKQAGVQWLHHHRQHYGINMKDRKHRL